MSREILEKLAANPHYKMSQKQLAELRKLRQEDKIVAHNPTFPMHETSFRRHDTKPRKEGDE